MSALDATPTFTADFQYTPISLSPAMTSTGADRRIKLPFICLVSEVGLRMISAGAMPFEQALVVRAPAPHHCP
jgi:hypothetical protein